MSTCNKCGMPCGAGKRWCKTCEVKETAGDMDLEECPICGKSAFSSNVACSRCRGPDGEVKPELEAEL